jgi:rhamnosyltransferase
MDMNGGLTAESDSTAERNIVALATLYFPSEQNAANARLIAQQVSEVILLDNTPGADNSALFSDIENAKYIANGRNLGLSAAFNSCMDFNEVKTSDFLVFFDQDSEVVPGQMETLAHDFEVLEQNHKVGCLGPVFLDTNKNKLRGKEQTSTPAENNCWHVTAVITSSCMTRRRILERTRVP